MAFDTTRDKNGKFLAGRKTPQAIKDAIKKSWEIRRLTPFSAETRKKMGDSHRGEKAYNWKGGKHIRKDGYEIFASSKKYIHRHIFEKIIGRKLNPKEVIHHIDGNPSNNKIENLYLFRNNVAHLRVEHYQNRHGITLPLESNHKIYAGL